MAAHAMSVSSWLQSLFKLPVPVGPPEAIRVFTTADPTITADGITVEEDGWIIDAQQSRTVRLFEVPDPGAEQCLITYRAKMKSQDVTGRAFLEMWCRFGWRGEFFSKGFQQSVQGTTGWASYEIPFYLKKGQRPDLIKLNLVVEGAGKIWMKEIELLKTPLG
ncbi:MAG: hypothetical protein ACREU8_03035 [Gammaproteobacteria bacterium]